MPLLLLVCVYDRDVDEDSDEEIGCRDRPTGQNSWIPSKFSKNFKLLNLFNNKKKKETSPMNPEVLSVSDQENSILDVAAASGHPYLVRDIVSEHPNPHLLTKPNSMDDLSLHVAASAGHLHLVEETSPMSPEVFSAVRAGNREFLRKIKIDDKQLAFLVSDEGDSILHVATASGHPYLVRDIVSEHPNLLTMPNSMDELSLHVAASAGHLHVVEVIVAFITYMSNNNSTFKIRKTADDIYRFKNQRGDTPLHAALKSNHVKVACCLVSADPSVSFIVNKERLSPFYLTVEAGYTELVKDMLNFPTTSTDEAGSSTSSSSILPFQEKSIIHAAMRAKKIDILDAILGKYPTLVTTSKNEEGRTCLSYGASIGYYEGISYLLEKFPESHLYVCDNHGFFPIHMAAKNGQFKIIKKFLTLCPNSRELLTKHGQNILHIAAKYGKAQVVKYILKLDKKGRLINEEDFDGNTPLHLATGYWHPKVVSLLTWDPRTDLKTQNYDGGTALDITEERMHPGYILRERLTWMALISARAQRGKKLRFPSGTMQHRRSFRPVDARKYKDRVNTLLLVSTLVATMTFAAGFTLPGGYNSSAPNLGMATLTEKAAFKVFLICNAIAIYSSVVTIVALIWAQLGDIALILKVFQLALPILGIALTSMSVAFMAGVSLVVSHLPWLSYIILGINSAFLLALLLLLIPYISPQTPSQPLLRHIFYYPYFLMLLAVGDQTIHD